MAARRHPDTLNQDSKQHFFYHRFTISTSSRRGYPEPRIGAAVFSYITLLFRTPLHP
ncbi:hypothetical protein FOXYSP1_04899 [Fusarium oxysporum f. sp. phaseoli]